MQTSPQPQHDWLTRLVGNWTYESECVMGPDQPAWISQGTQVVRSIGGLWTIGEMAGEMPDGGTSTSLITLGYDPLQDRYVGTFIASMMTYLWIYNGALDEAGKVLTLNAEGPNFTQDGMAQYQDIITVIDEDNYTLTSQVQGADGNWTHFMTIRFQRQS